MVEVVAALIWKEGRFLACQRPVHKARGFLWEFVGGKVEKNETHAQALTRECVEELGIKIQVKDLFMDVVHRYPDIDVHLFLYNAIITTGEPRLLEHNDLRWITPDEIPSLQFCPADDDILKEIINRYM